MRRRRRSIAFDELDVNAQLSSIVNRALTLSEFRIVHPFIRVERDAQSRLNLKALIPPEDPNAKPEPESPPPRLIIASATIEGGRVAVIDRSGRQPYETELGPLNLQVSDLNTLPNEEGNQRLVVQTRFGGHLEWTGKMTVRPFTASGHISLAGEKLTEDLRVSAGRTAGVHRRRRARRRVRLQRCGNNEGRATRRRSRT